MGEKCPICQNYTQSLKALHQSYAGESVEFVGLFPNAYSTPEGISEFQQKYALPFTLKQDKGQALTQQFGVTVTPEVVVFDEQRETVLYQGRIDNLYARVGRRRSSPTTHELQDVLASISQGNSPEPTRTTPIGCYITLEKKAEMHHDHH